MRFQCLKMTVESSAGLLWAAAALKSPAQYWVSAALSKIFLRGMSSVGPISCPRLQFCFCSMQNIHYLCLFLQKSGFQTQRLAQYKFQSAEVCAEVPKVCYGIPWHCSEKGSQVCDQFWKCCPIFCLVPLKSSRQLIILFNLTLFI